MSTDLAPELCRPERNAGCSLDELARALGELLDGDPSQAKGAAVADLLRQYASCEESWRPYVTFRDDTYSRNLIWRTAQFELLILGWEAGQESPIHDHAGQQCWMAVLEGELEEVHFAEGDVKGATEDAIEDRGAGGLRPGRVKAFPTGGVAYIHDEIALHLIRPRVGQRAVSLHLYSSPIDSCRKFCPDTGQPQEVHVAYHTVRGTSCAGTDPELIREAWTRVGGR